MPKLLKTYLAIGARICAPPAWDREFGTIDFLTLLDLEDDLALGAQSLSGSFDFMSFLAFRRAVALVFALGLRIIRFWLLRLRGPLTLEKRALWVQQTCRGILSIVGIRLHSEGTPPTHGLVVANHLSYLDILILLGGDALLFCRQNGDRRLALLRQGRAAGRYDLS